jgi:hypothetical protein
MLYKRMGRPPKQPDQPIVCVTLRVPAHLKAHLIEMADALDMPINEYVITLLERDASEPKAG